MKLTAWECQKRSERAFQQAKKEHLHGVEHVELIEACGRAWISRMEWAQRNGGVWDSEKEEFERRAPA